MTQRLLTFRRWWIGRRQLEHPFRALIGAPPPSPATRFADAQIVSLDIETTGIDAASVDMLSVGWVLIRNGTVDLSSAETYIVKPGGDVGPSASVHGLTDTMVESGHPWSIVFDKIVEALIGRALLVHHAGLDKSLLDRLCRTRFGSPLLVPVIDTLALEQRRQRRRHHVDGKPSLRLADVRESYNLPWYNAHDCLVDAIATAELLIAMVAHSDGPQKTRLRDLYT